MRTVLLLLLSLASYAAGAVVARRASASRASSPGHPVEVLLVTGALVALAWVRGSHPFALYLLICAAAMFLVGMVVARVGRPTHLPVSGGTREFEEARAQAPATSAWKRWLAFSRSIADYEVRLVIVASYLLFIGPVALAFRLLSSDPFPADSPSTWAPREESSTLDAARRTF